MVKNALSKALPISSPERNSAPVLVDVANDGRDADAPDYFCEKDGLRYAGGHLLVDLWGASNLDDPEFVEQTLTEAARAARATLLHAHVHHFSPYGGVTGVVVLAESHITIHTWPERDFAAIDIFMCGSCNPFDALPILRRAFKPGTLQVSEQKRGLIP